MTTLFEIAAESIRFATNRFQQNLETQQAMLGCRKPEDLLLLQTEFHRKAIEQYAAEATRMFEIMSKSKAQSLAQVKSAYARGYDDVPL